MIRNKRFRSYPVLIELEPRARSLSEYLSAAFIFAFLMGSSVSVVSAEQPSFPGISPADASQAVPATVMPDKPTIKEGVQAYKAGNYKKAIGLLGAVLSSDFNNPVLHYYMANSYLHLKQTDAAIREFRIAYALEPDKEVGKYSRDALSILTGDETRALPLPGDAMMKAPEKPPLPPVPSQHEALVGQSVSQLRSQAQSLKDIQTRSNEAILADEQRRQQDYLARAKTDLQNQYKYYTRRGRVIQAPVPTDAQATLSSLKDLYDRQHASRAEMSRRQSEELQKSARNLEDLLNEKPGHGGTHLVPAGTNLYIRNYQSEPKPAEQNR